MQKLLCILGLFGVYLLNAKDLESRAFKGDLADSKTTFAQLDLPQESATHQNALNSQNLPQDNSENGESAKNANNANIAESADTAENANSTNNADNSDNANNTNNADNSDNALFPLLNAKSKEALLHNEYLDSNATLAAPKPLDALSLLPLEEWRGNYVLYLYNFSPMTNPLYRRDEAKVQVSFRVPLVRNIFRSGGIFYFGLTDTFFFQVLNDRASSPVRDNDFQPEFFYTYPLKISFLGGALTEFSTGWRHISNGEVDRIHGGSEDKSRGSDRWSFKLIWQSKHFGVDWESFFPVRYYAENPNIYRYMGGLDIKLYLRFNKHLADMTLYGLTKKNFTQYRSGVRVSYTYKLNPYVGVYVQYFVGYGDYLYEYDRFGHRLGLGLRFVR